MSMFKHRKILALLPALLIAAACSDSGEPLSQADLQLNEDVALYVADMTADDLYMLDVQVGGILADGLFASPPMPPRFSDLTITREVTFYGDSDGDGVGDVEQDGYHWLETASIHFVFHMEGSHSRTGEMGTLDVTVNRDRDMWLTGLLDQETERTWNGTGSSAVSRSLVSDERGDRQYDMSSTSLVEDVVVAVPRFENPWPLSGTITRTVHVEVVSGDETIVRDKTVVITFDGDQYVTMTVDGEDFELDLAQRHAHRRDRMHK